MEPEESGNNPMAGSSEPTTQPSNSSKSSANPLSEKSVINSSKPEFVASFLSLDISFVTNLPSAVFEKISARANEFEALKSQRLLDEVSYAQASELKESSMKLEREKSQLQIEIASLQGKSSTSDTTTKSLEKRLETIAAEKTQTLETLDRRNKDIRELRSELEQLQKKHLDCRKNIVELENDAQKVRSEQMAAKLREQNLLQEVELVKRNNEWLDSELKSKGEEFKKFRKDKLALISQLQSDMDSLSSEYHTLQKSHQTLRDRFSEVSQQYDGSLVKIKDLQNTQVVNEEAFKSEMASQQRLGELWEKSAKDAKARVQELTKTLQQERERDTNDLVHWQHEAEKYKSRTEKLELQLGDLEKQIEEVHIQNDNSISQGSVTAFPSSVSTVPRTPLGQTSTPGAAASSSSSALFSPSAHIISQIQKGGGSLVQLYSEFQETKVRLERERHKNESLRREMDQILEEMETNAPAILAEREENKRLELELADLSVQLEKSTVEVEETRAKFKTTNLKYSDCQHENDLLSQQIRDLSRQIQHLLIQSHVSNDGEGPLSPQEHFALQKLLHGSDDNSESDTDKLISERLVLFKDVIELQQQNEYLLKVTRELGQKMEKEESESRTRLENLESSVVEEAKTTIKSLKEQLDGQSLKMEALQRERDMFRRMMSNKGDQNNGQQHGENDVNAPFAQQLIKQNEEVTTSLKELQALFDSQRQESMSTIKSLNEQIKDLQTHRSDLSIQISKAQGQVELANERYKNLNENMELLRTENNEFKKRNQSLQDSLAKQDIKTQQVAEELIEAKSLVESMRSENTNLKTEKQLWKSIESRITKENSDLFEEKGRLNGILANMRLIETNRESSESELRKRLNTQVENLENQVSKLQARLDKEIEETRQVSERRDVDSREFQSRIDRLNSDLSTAQDELKKAKDSYSSLQSMYTELEAELKAAQETVEIFQAREREVDPRSKEAIMASELSSLKSELELSKHECSIANSHVNELTEVARAAEEALQSLTTSHDEFEQNMNETLQKKDDEIKSLKETLESTRTMMQNANEEFSSKEKSEQERFAKLEQDKSNLENMVKSLQANETRLTEMQESLKEELQKQSEIARTAQDNYEKELVKHADAANTAQTLRVELNDLKEQVLLLTTSSKQSVEQMETSETSWNTQKYAYEHEVEQLKDRCNDLSLQNKLLLDQLEVATGRQDKTMTDEDERTVVGSSDEQLRELLNYLKREKEIVELNYDLALQEKKRLQQKLDHTTSSLDEARLELEKERSKETDTLRSSAEHEKLLQQLQDLNVLRESNSSLRSQSTYYSNKAKELEDELSDLKQKTEPLEEKLQEALSEIKAKDEQILLIQQDSDKWKTKSQQMLEKYERIDPQELHSLKENLDNAKREVEGLTKEKSELLTKLNTIETEKNAMDSKYKELEVSSDNTSKELTKLQTRFDNLLKESQGKLQRRRAETVELREELKSLKEELAKSQEAQQSASQDMNSDQSTELSKLQEELATAKAELEKAKVEVENGKADLVQTQTTLDSLRSENNSSLLEKEKRISDLESEYNRVSDEVVELQRELAAKSGEDASGVTDLIKSKSQLEEELSELKREAETLRKNSVPSSEVEKQLNSLREELSKKQGLNSDQPAEDATTNTIREALKEELKGEIEKETLQKYKENSRARIRAMLEKKTAEIQQKFNEQFSKTIEEKDARIQELTQQTSSGTTSANSDELRKATEMGRASGRKEAEMRSSLLLKKLEKEKESLKAELEKLKGVVQPNVISNTADSKTPTAASAEAAPAVTTEASTGNALAKNVNQSNTEQAVSDSKGSSASTQTAIGSNKGVIAAVPKSGSVVPTKDIVHNTVTGTSQKSQKPRKPGSQTSALGVNAQGSKIPRPHYAKPTVQRPGSSTAGSTSGTKEVKNKRVLSQEGSEEQSKKKRKEEQQS